MTKEYTYSLASSTCLINSRAKRSWLTVNNGSGASWWVMVLPCVDVTIGRDTSSARGTSSNIFQVKWYTGKKHLKITALEDGLKILISWFGPMAFQKECVIDDTKTSTYFLSTNGCWIDPWYCYRFYLLNCKLPTHLIHIFFCGNKHANIKPELFIFQYL